MGHKRSALLLIKTNYMSKANNNVVSREMCAPSSVRTTSLYFHKARTLRHTSALLRYHARSLRHRYERAQLTIHFVKEIKKLASRALLSHVSAWKFLRTLEKYEKHSCFSALRSCSLKFPSAYITQQCTRHVFLFR